jgi:hypothetical protein
MNSAFQETKQKPSKLGLAVNWAKLKLVGQSNETRTVDLLLQRVAKKGVHPDIATSIVGKGHSASYVCTYIRPYNQMASDHMLNFREVIVHAAGEALSANALKSHQPQMEAALMNIARTQDDPLAPTAFDIIAGRRPRVLESTVEDFFGHKNQEVAVAALKFVCTHAFFQHKFSEQRRDRKSVV